MKFPLVLTVLTLAVGSLGAADDSNEVYAKAFQSFSQRRAQQDDPAIVDTIRLLSEAAKFSESTPAEKNLKVQSLLLLSRAYQSSASVVPCHAFGLNSKAEPCYQRK